MCLNNMSQTTSYNVLTHKLSTIYLTDNFTMCYAHYNAADYKNFLQYLDGSIVRFCPRTLDPMSSRSPINFVIGRITFFCIHDFFCQLNKMSNIKRTTKKQ